MKISTPLNAIFVAILVACQQSAIAKDSDYPANVYFGDTHNHTGNSFDVYLFGTPSSTPETAYRYAKGEKITNPTTGEQWQINTPLDFLVIADHAEMLGNMPLLFDENLPLLAETKSGKAFLKLGGSKSEEELLEVYYELQNANDGKENKLGLTAKEMAMDLHAGEKRRTAWERYISEAEKHNDPGNFSAIIGWEWTSNTKGANLHRVVFQSQDGDVAKKYLPYSTFESDDPEDLWEWLDSTSKATGATFVAIPHNPNISRNRMFPTERNNGKPVDKSYSQARSKWEPVVEVTQIKGDSETHPDLSPNDEFADFETYTFVLTPDGSLAEPDKADYVRSGLLRGLEFQSQLGVNPYKVGMIGSTDAHTGIAAAEENNFAGKGQHDSKPEIRNKPTGLGSSKGWDMAAAGYAAVWAKENTREEIVAAFKRKEVYATSGPRITLRFFAGYDFDSDNLDPQSLVKQGYQNGVPMGGDLTPQSDKSPTFMASVLKAPDGANLDRMQIVKGWLDEKGEARERIYDIAVSDGRSINEEGRCTKEVGNTVDLKTGKYENSIGAQQFTVAWEDPNFNPAQHSFYYVRALEIPTPRYSLLDAIKLGIDYKETNQPATIQERVYSSPIWYTPN
ncbi:DUF3604 domain-containing protein [Thalassotalea sp. PS06]|uniref:DUF3604 domain-containing protein n=1 Tax=Thalassotalea sp. PS06 TaxID=2594005 RepID=UPI001C8F2083|nr:DUF3604 domain-containing protein [Thalassotalea sp. PS06]